MDDDRADLIVETEDLYEVTFEGEAYLAANSLAAAPADSPRAH